MANEDLVSREVTYPGRACNLKAFVAEPAANRAAPAVIVVQEWWGLNEHIRDVTRGDAVVLLQRAHQLGGEVWLDSAQRRRPPRKRAKEIRQARGGQSL